MLLDDVRKTLEAAFSNLTPSKAQELAKGLMEPGAAKEQIAKTAAELMEWSQGNRDRLATYIRKEIAEQMKNAGVASHTELNALKKRVRDLERAAGMTASGRSAKKATTEKSAAKRSTGKRSTARKPSVKEGTARAASGSTSPGSPASG